MFDSGYYKNRYVYSFEDTGYMGMVEINRSRRECYVFLPNRENPEDYYIYLRKFETKPLDPERLEPLGTFLESHGYRGHDFINPFKRTKLIVNELDRINKLRKDKTLIKK